nr:hypothetical protein CFP56_08674 [Quercus suber]
MKVEAGGGNSRKLEATVKDKRGCFGTRWRWDCHILAGQIVVLVPSTLRKLFYFGGPNAGNCFLEKCFYMHDQTLKILFRCFSNSPKPTSENIFP